MAEVIWSPSALEDVDQIAEYISRDSPDRASLLVQRFVEATENLPEFPKMGSIIPEIGEAHCREVAVWPYRIMYRIEGQNIWITGVVHGARNWKP